MQEISDRTDYGSMTLREFLDRLSSEIPTPGGGSACGIVASIAAGLTAMSAAYALGREKYAAIQDEMEHVNRRAQSLHDKCLDLATADSEAYERFLDARKLPRTTTKEEEIRKARMDTALREATDIPLDIADAAREIADLAKHVANVGNPALRADALVGMELADAVVRGCAEQVKVNLQHITDEDYRKPAEERLKELMR